MSTKYKFHDSHKLDYIHENPVKHGFAKLAECYDWSSAIDYAGGKGLVDIEILF